MMKTKRILTLSALLLAPLAAPAAVVASIGGEKIDDVEFSAKLAAEERNLNRKLSADEAKAVLQALINQRLLVAKAKADGLPKKDEIRRTLQDAERQVLANWVYDSEVASKARVTEGEVKAFFDANPALFELREISQILVRPLSPEKSEAAESEAKRLKAKAASSPKSFAELAKSESDDTISRDKGGDLGALRRGMLLKELEEAAFSAKPGSIVGPVKTQFGWHILYVRSVRKQGYDEAKDVIARELTRAKAAELQQKLLEGLAKTFTVKVSAAK